MENTKDFLSLESNKLNINDIIQSVVSPNCGAVSTFIGTTRDNFEEKKVLKLEYEAYEPMAIKEMQGVCKKVRSQWNVEKIAIFHRLGEVPTMEASIVVAISSPHRLESLEAVQFTIDAVKTSVPIWKKEIYENEESEWKENKECFWAKSILKPKEEINKTKENKDSNSQANNNDMVIEDVNIDIDNVYETVEITSEIINDDNCCDSDNSIEDVIIDPDQIQIKADSDELNRRISSFISRKREHVNMLNIQEFCANNFEQEDDGDDGDDGTCVCARVNAVVSKYKDSVSHVKVHRVYNQWSQLKTKPNDTKQNMESNNYSSALEERLSTTEKILGINKPVSRDIYERLKKVEDRLLVLESISPEYKDLWSIDDCGSEKSYDKSDDKMNSLFNSKQMRKRTYPASELDSKLNEIEFRYGKRAK